MPHCCRTRSAHCESQAGQLRSRAYAVPVMLQKACGMLLPCMLQQRMQVRAACLPWACADPRATSLANRAILSMQPNHSHF